MRVMIAFSAHDQQVAADHRVRLAGGDADRRQVLGRAAMRT
jgi:hypothetical protein